MSVEENKAVVRRFMEEGWNAGNEQALADQVFHADVILASTGEVLGLERLKRACGTNRTAFPDVNLVIHDLIAEGNQVAVRWTFTGTHRGEFMGVAPTGKQVTYRGMSILRIKDGKVVEIEDIANELAILRQLGATRIPD